MANRKITLQEKENPPRVKETYSTLTITASISGEPKTDKTSKSVSLKIDKPLVEKITGPFDENNTLVEEMEVGKIYIFRATKFKKSTFTPIKHICLQNN